jgi:hypothetical protein
MTVPADVQARIDATSIFLKEHGANVGFLVAYCKDMDALVSVAKAAGVVESRAQRGERITLDDVALLHHALRNLNEQGANHLADH